jgi:menaquinone-dependent protoporphyrinogen IX oxidase
MKNIFETFVIYYLSAKSVEKYFFEKYNEKMCCVSARRLSIHKTYNKFKNKFAEYIKSSPKTLTLVNISRESEKGAELPDGICYRSPKINRIDWGPNQSLIQKEKSLS